MSHEIPENVNFARFVDHYMDTKTQAFVFQASEIKIYPLSIALSLMKLPTPLFRADYNFLLIFLAGGGKQQIDNEVFELKSNDVLFIREGHLNAIKSIDANTEGYFIYIGNALLPKIFANSALLHRFTFYPKHFVSQSDMKWLCKCCELIVMEKTDSVSMNEIQVALLRAIFLKLAEASAAARSKPDRKSEVNMLFKELLYEQFLSKREVKYYADSLAVSENYLNRCVNQITQKPPKQHIIEMVIVYSKVLLQDNAKDISQVAFELNFSSPSYFGKMFKQLTGQTPTEYKRSIMHGLSE